MTISVTELLPPQIEYTSVLGVIERSILATDLATHFRAASDISALANEAEAAGLAILNGLGGRRHRLQSLLMTAADLGAATKPWKVNRLKRNKDVTSR